MTNGSNLVLTMHTVANGVLGWARADLPCKVGGGHRVMAVDAAGAGVGGILGMEKVS